MPVPWIIVAIGIPRVRSGFEQLHPGVDVLGLGEGHAQVLIRIDGRVVDADLIVEVGAGAASAKSDVADSFAFVDALSGGDIEARKMSVAGGDAVAVIDLDEVSVAAHVTGIDDDAISRRNDRIAVGARNIDAGVECAFTAEWVRAFAERT